MWESPLMALHEEDQIGVAEHWDCYTFQCKSTVLNLQNLSFSLGLMLGHGQTDRQTDVISTFVNKI